MSQPNAMLSFQLSQGIHAAILRLLETKHLYQSVDVPRGFLDTYIENAAKSARPEAERKLAMTTGNFSRRDYVEQAVRSAENLAKKTVALLLATPWQPTSETAPPKPIHAAPGNGRLDFTLPTVKAFCSHCEQQWPFNPGTNANWGSLRATTYELQSPQLIAPESTPSSGIDIAAALINAAAGKRDAHQLFLLHYQCQCCKGAPVSFLVRRTGLKLTLCGREPLEQIQMPAFIPKAHRKYLSNAVVAHHAGQTLAGIFLLRTFIEQFWLTSNLVTAPVVGRNTGDELGEAYNRSLPTDFKSRFPSLPGLYAKLSAAMHKAEASADLFEQAREEIIEHFDARRLHKLDNQTAPANDGESKGAD